MNSSLSATLNAHVYRNTQNLLHQSHFTIAVTGHRMNRLTVESYAALTDPIDQIIGVLTSSLESWRTAHSPYRTASSLDPVVLSALAEGADRLVAKRALAHGWQLSAVLPFRQDEYQHDFTTQASKHEFMELLSMAHNARELDNTRQQSEPTAYEAVGRALAFNCDLLIAIWDGNSARGPGGTAEVVELAQSRGVSVVWVKPDAPYEIIVM